MLAFAAMLIGTAALAQNIHTAAVHDGSQEYADNSGNTYRPLTSNEDGSFTGTLTKYYEEDAVSEQGQFVKGKKEGVWFEYNKKGNKISQAQFKNGLKHGEWFVWNDKGQVLYHMFYKEGQRIGTWKIWNNDGELIDERKY